MKYENDYLNDIDDGNKMKSLTNSAILELLDSDQKKELYWILRKEYLESLPKSYVTVEKKIIEMREKYSDLVWYARRRPEDIDFPGVQKAIDDVEEKYPDDVEKYQDDPDWKHGFNSGALAISRLLRPYALDENYRKEFEEDWVDTRDSEIEFATRHFPDLNT